MKLYIFTGFLGSGKSTALEHFVKHFQIVEGKKKKQYLLSCEQGKTAYSSSLLEQMQANIQIERKVDLEEALQQFAQEQADTDAVLWVEYNGTWKLELLFQCLKKYPSFQIKEIFAITNEAQMQFAFNDLSTYLKESFYHCSQVLVLPSSEQALSPSLFRQIKNLVRHDKIGLLTEEKILEILRTERLSPSYIGGFVLCGLWSLLLAFAYLHAPFSKDILMQVQSFSTTFLSLCLQILPFILVSAALSSFLQLFVKENYFQRLNKDTWFSLPLTLVLALILPICDCGLIPIWTRLVKKGMRFELGLFLFTSSCVLNPLVLASTYFAFPDQPLMLYYRVGLGLMLSLIFYISMSLYLAFSKRDFSKELCELYCEASVIDVENSRSSNFKLWVNHTFNEFFILSEKVLWGIFISLGVDFLIKQYAGAWLTTSSWASFVFLAFALVFMGVCANANAFISKNFTYFLPPKFLLLYMIFSPYVDFKNLLLIYEGFGKYLSKIYFVGVALFLVAFALIFYALPHAFFPTLNNLLFNY